MYLLLLTLLITNIVVTQGRQPVRTSSWGDRYSAQPGPQETTPGTALHTLHARTEGPDTCAYMRIKEFTDHPITCADSYTCSVTTLPEYNLSAGCCGHGYSGGTSYACGFYNGCVDSTELSTMSALYSDTESLLFCTQSFATLCQVVVEGGYADYLVYGCGSTRYTDPEISYFPTTSLTSTRTSDSRPTLATSASSTAGKSITSSSSASTTQRSQVSVSIPLSPTSATASSATPTSTSVQTRKDVSAIAGGVAGGAAGMIALIGAGCFLLQKRRRAERAKPAELTFRVLGSNLRQKAIPETKTDQRGQHDGLPNESPRQLPDELRVASLLQEQVLAQNAFHQSVQDRYRYSCSAPNSTSHIELPSTSARGDIHSWSRDPSTNSHHSGLTLPPAVSEMDGVPAASGHSMSEVSKVDRARGVYGISDVDHEELSANMSSRSGPVAEW